MLQLLSLIIIHSAPFDEVAQGPSLTSQESKSFSLKGGKTIQVTQILFSGNKAISNQQLDNLVRNYENKMLSERDIQEIQRRVELLYKTRGYNDAKVSIPVKQKSGTLEIVIVEGKKAQS